MPSHTNKSAVILGAGIAGLTTARLLSLNGFEVTVVEHSSKLGGHVANWSCKATSECQVCHCCSLSDLISSIEDLPVKILTGHELVSVAKDSTGRLTKVALREISSGSTPELRADALALATGFEMFNASEKLLWRYGQLEGVITLADLDALMIENRFPDSQNVVEKLRIAFFQCVGSRDKSVGANYCSQYCCKAALRAALKIISERPDYDVTIFYIDLQVAGKYASELLRKAREAGIRLAQGVPGEILGEDTGKLSVVFEKDGLNVREEFDRIVLSVGQRPSSSSATLAQITGVGLDEFGYFRKLGELERFRTTVDGIYVAGACSGPMDIETTMLAASAVASDIIRNFSR